MAGVLWLSILALALAPAAGQQAQQDCEGCGLDMQEDVSSLLEHKKHTQGDEVSKGLCRDWEVPLPGHGRHAD